MASQQDNHEFSPYKAPSTSNYLSSVLYFSLVFTYNEPKDAKGRRRLVGQMHRPRDPEGPFMAMLLVHVS